jgi:two-component system chemotaxis response regulator CheB
MIGIVVIAASAGGHDPLFRIIAALPVPCTAAVFVVMHIGPYPSILPEVLASRGKLPVMFPQNGTLIEAGHIYVAPPDHHMLLEAAAIRLTQSPKVHYTRPAADPTFISAAKSYGSQVIGIVLSGGDGDGAVGLRAITQHSGVSFVQDPAEAEAPSMPRSAILADHPDAVLPIEEIAQRVHSFCLVKQPAHNS